MTEQREQFGCDKCWPDSTDQAWGALRALAIEKELIDESHFMVKIRCCPACSQRFVWVFTELIDWSDGEDPQSWTVLPITQTEAREFCTSGATTAKLNALGPGRRSLRRGSTPKAMSHTRFGAPAS